MNKHFADYVLALAAAMLVLLLSACALPGDSVCSGDSGDSGGSVDSVGSGDSGDSGMLDDAPQAASALSDSQRYTIYPTWMTRWDIYDDGDGFSIHEEKIVGTPPIEYDVFFSPFFNDFVNKDRNKIYDQFEYWDNYVYNSDAYILWTKGDESGEALGQLLFMDENRAITWDGNGKEALTDVGKKTIFANYVKLW